MVHHPHLRYHPISFRESPASLRLKNFATYTQGMMAPPPLRHRSGHGLLLVCALPIATLLRKFGYCQNKEMFSLHPGIDGGAFYLGTLVSMIVPCFYNKVTRDVKTSFWQLDSFYMTLERIDFDTSTLLLGFHNESTNFWQDKVNSWYGTLMHNLQTWIMYPKTL